MIHTPSTAAGIATAPSSIGPDHCHIAGVARELDSRASDGIHVQLLWYPHDGHVSVIVNDAKAGATFELEVRDGELAMDTRPLDVDALLREAGR